MSCEDVTNALAALLFVSFLVNVVLATVIRCSDDYDDPIGESLLRDGQLSMVSLADSDEEDVFFNDRGVLRDPYSVLPPGYRVAHVRSRGGAVEPVLPGPDDANAAAAGAVPGNGDV